MSTRDEFEALGRGGQPGFAAELLAFLAQNKKWWLGPIILALLAFAALLMFSGGAAAPFIYTLF